MKKRFKKYKILWQVMEKKNSTMDKYFAPKSASEVKFSIRVY